MLSLHGITIQRARQITARQLSLRFEAGSVHAILGPNGTGKSSMIKAIFGEIPLTAGNISYEDRPLDRRRLSRWRKPIGYMPQDTHVEASLTTLEVVLLGQLDALHMHISDEKLAEAVAVMESVGIAHLAHRNVQSLSGGQRQLALFAQVLFRKPRLLLLDEPVSALDMHHQFVLLEHVHQETRARNLTTIMVLHDLSLAAQFADRLILLGEGCVQAEGLPEQVLDPELIGRLYQVEVERLTDSAGAPVIRPKRRLSSA